MTIKPSVRITNIGIDIFALVCLIAPFVSPPAVRGNDIGGPHLLYAVYDMPDNEHLRLAPTKLDGLDDDRFLERIQFDYARVYLFSFPREARTEIDAFIAPLYCMASERGWVDRETAAEWVLKLLRQYEKAETARGIFPRMFNRTTGKRIQGQPYDIVGTGFFACSTMLFIRPYFDADNPTETEIRELASKIYERIDFNYAYDSDRECFWWNKNGDDPSQFDGKPLRDWFDETFSLQLIALSSPSWDHDDDAYDTYTSTMKWESAYGYDYFMDRQLGYLLMPHLWFDFRDYRDRVCRTRRTDYFENTRRAVMSHIAYAQKNPGDYPYYGDVWGFYDCESPLTGKWTVMGLPPEGEVDEGTVSLSAVISSISFEPEQTMSCLRTLYRKFKHKGIYTDKGFMMSVNTKTGLVARGPDEFFLPINALMIENYRSNLFWDLAKQAPEYKTAFEGAGLKPSRSKR